jgi:hypothetical protein
MKYKFSLKWKKQQFWKSAQMKSTQKQLKLTRMACYRKFYGMFMTIFPFLEFCLNWCRTIQVKTIKIHSFDMIDSDQRPDSNRHPLLKSASTDVIISNQHPLTSLSQIGIHWRHYRHLLLRSMSSFKFSNLWPFLNFSNQRPMTSLTYALTLTLTNRLAIDLRIWKGRRFEIMTSVDADLR